MTGAASVCRDRANEQVEGLIPQGTALVRVEDAIAVARFALDHEAALRAAPDFDSAARA
jgi:hypothetical protein